MATFDSYKKFYLANLSANCKLLVSGHLWHSNCLVAPRASLTLASREGALEPDPGVPGAGTDRDHVDQRAGPGHVAGAHSDRGAPIHTCRGRHAVPPRGRPAPLLRRAERPPRQGAGRGRDAPTPQG